MFASIDGPNLLFAPSILQRIEGIALHPVVLHPHLNLLGQIIVTIMKNLQDRQSRTDLQNEEVQSRNYEILSLLEELFQIRLVEKLGRPMQLYKKEEVYKEFKRKFIILHQLLERMRKEVGRQNESTQSRNKSLNSNKVVRQRIQKQDIKKIQSKYTEILVDGSFKFYPKVAKLYNFPLTLELINIDEWANQCLEEEVEKKGCCC